MKKYIVGTLFGFLLAFTVSAHAEVVNMFGKVVDGSFPLLINGQKSANDAVTIEGTSYIPVRSAGELFGYDVSFLDSQVILRKKEGAGSVTNVTYDQATQDKLNKWEQDRSDSSRQIKDLQIKAKSEEDALTAKREKAAEQKIKDDAEFQKVKAIDDQRAAEYKKQLEQQQAQQQQPQTQHQLQP